MATVQRVPGALGSVTSGKRRRSNSDACRRMILFLLLLTLSISVKGEKENTLAAAHLLLGQGAVVVEIELLEDGPLARVRALVPLDGRRVGLPAGGADEDPIE